MEEEGVIVNNFCNYNFLRFSMDFELFQRFQVKDGLTRFVLTYPNCKPHCKSTRVPFWTRSSPW
jgi:hypothetical protein